MHHKPWWHSVPHWSVECALTAPFQKSIPKASSIILNNPRRSDSQVFHNSQFPHTTAEVISPRERMATLDKNLKESVNCRDRRHRATRQRNASQGCTLIKFHRHPKESPLKESPSAPSAVFPLNPHSPTIPKNLKQT